MNELSGFSSTLQQRPEAADLVGRLHALSRFEHSDLSIGDEAAVVIAELCELLEELEFNRQALKIAHRDLTEARQSLGTLLACIHGDGGHYQAKHGTAKAVDDAVSKWYELRS